MRNPKFTSGVSDAPDYLLNPWDPLMAPGDTGTSENPVSYYKFQFRFTENNQTANH